MATPAISSTLYRKYRPRNFADLIAQEPVTTVLQQAVFRNRTTHAYLFCGPRGTGKTTAARIMAKAVNCLNSQDGDACSSCANCSLIQENKALDLTEMDAATNRSIADVRDIREKALYPPSRLKYRIFIIDEAHAYTREAAQALLKILEEPPPQTMFILCTTEQQDLIPTIVSRCQRHDFRRISSAQTTQRLQYVAACETISLEPSAAALIANAANGALRDALNILEQASLSHPEQPVTETAVREMLGMANPEQTAGIALGLLNGNLKETLQHLQTCLEQGADARNLQQEVTLLLRHAMLIAAGNDGLENIGETVTQRIRNTAPSLPDAYRCLKAWTEVKTALRQDGVSLEIAAAKACQPELETVAVAATPAAAAAASSPADRQEVQRERWQDFLDIVNGIPEKGQYAAALLQDCPPELVSTTTPERVTIRFYHASHRKKFGDLTQDQQIRNAIGAAATEVWGKGRRLYISSTTGKPENKVNQSRPAVAGNQSERAGKPSPSAPVVQPKEPAPDPETIAGVLANLGATVINP